MLEILMKTFDKTIPQSIRYDVKEYVRAVNYLYKNIFANGEQRFSIVEVETNTDCNRACKICPRYNESRARSLMDESTFDNLLHQLSNLRFSGILTPVFYNEPLLDTRLADLMRKAKNMLPDAKLFIYTNGSLLNQENIKNLANCGVDLFIVSQYVQNLRKDDAREMISKLPLDLKKKIRHRIMTDDMTLSNRAGLVDVRNPSKKNICYQASTNVVLDYKGNVVLCCNDFHTEFIFGNINSRHIAEIWNDPAYRKIRKDLRKGTFNLDICKRCSGKDDKI